MKEIRPYTRFDKKPNVKCGYCKKAFFRYPVEIKRYQMMFCCKDCQGKWNKENVYSKINTVCDFCGNSFHRDPSLSKQYSLHFCNGKCRGGYWAKHFIGDKSSNWQGGKMEQRKHELQSTKYRLWRKSLLNNAKCILCNSLNALELHHIEARKDNPLRIRDESNVVPICEECHDLFHSKSSKGEELRESLKDILSQDNSQPSQSGDWKVQRLIGEGIKPNKPDTSIAPERDDIVRTELKNSEVQIKR